MVRRWHVPPVIGKIESGVPTIEVVAAADYDARIRELETALAKEKGGWDAFYKLRKSVGEARYPGMTAAVGVENNPTAANREGEHE